MIVFEFASAIMTMCHTGRLHALVLGTVPAGTCSRNMFSVHTISSTTTRVLQSRVPATSSSNYKYDQTMFGRYKPEVLSVRLGKTRIVTLRYR